MPMMSAQENIYTPAEVAQVLRVNEETIRREIRRDQLGAVQVGRQYRITPADLVAWLGKARYLEIFRPHEALLEVLGAGNLDEVTAAEDAQSLVYQARSESGRQLEGGAPTVAEVKQRRQ